MGHRTSDEIMERAGQRCLAIKRGWEGFWFAAQDPLTISLLRLLTGGMLFYALAMWSFDLHSFFAQDRGWQSAELVRTLQQGQWAFSFWWLVPDSYLGTAHAICLLVAAAFCIGLCTPVTKFAAFLIAISYANRVPMATFGLDQITCITTLYLCLGPCGARFSADRYFAKRSAGKRGLPVLWPRRSVAAGLALRMLQVHLCVIYFWSGISKLQGPSWWSGEAIWRVASNYEYQQVSLEWLAYVPWLYQVCTIGTWVWEISFPFLVWRREFKPFILSIGILMHLSIGLFLGMWTFGLAMCFSYLAFVPPSALRRVLSLMGGERRIHANRQATVPANDAFVVETNDDREVWMDAAPKPKRLREVDAPTAESASEPLESEPLESYVLSVTDFDSMDVPVSAAPLATSIAAEATIRASNAPVPRIANFESHLDADAPNLTPNTDTSATTTSSWDDSLMLNEHDFDNVILYVDSSTKRRSAMTEALEDAGIRCIGVDAWPEAIRMYNTLNLQGLLCNASRLQPTELRFWCHHLKGRANSIYIALIQSSQLPAMMKHDLGGIILQTIPANIAEICQIFEGNAASEVSLPQPTAAPGSFLRESSLSLHPRADLDASTESEHTHVESPHLEAGHIVKYAPPQADAAFDSTARVEGRRL
jgi:hypothetical protein